MERSYENIALFRRIRKTWSRRSGRASQAAASDSIVIGPLQSISGTFNSTAAKRHLDDT